MLPCGDSDRVLCSPEDVKRLSNKLVEVSTTKLELQMKLDELETSEVSIKVMIKLKTSSGPPEVQKAMGYFT